MAETIVYLVDLPGTLRNKTKSVALFVGAASVADDIMKRLRGDEILMRMLPDGADSVVVYDASGYPPGHVARCRQDAEQWKTPANVSDDWIVQRAVDLVHDLLVADGPSEPNPVPTAQTSGSVDDDANLSPSKLAEIFGVELNALQQRLKRWRRKNHVGWIEVTDRCSREAQYLYRVGTVRPLVEKMKTTSETTSKRPAKK